jgi:hypothetical protein
MVNSNSLLHSDSLVLVDLPMKGLCSRREWWSTSGVSFHMPSLINMLLNLFTMLGCQHFLYRLSPKHAAVLGLRVFGN